MKTKLLVNEAVNSIETFLSFLESLTQHAPLEVVVLVGTFIEEVLSPLPSFMVLVPVGAAAKVQGLPLWYLVILALFSGVGRIAGAVLLYWIADRSEALILRRRRFFGVSHKDVEQFGQRLGRSGPRDWWLLFAMNAVPIFPTAMLSVVCGFVKVRFGMFLTTTFFGTLINACIYLGLGYGGIMAATAVRGLEIATQFITGLLLVVLGVWLLRRQRKTRRVPAPTKKSPSRRK